MAKQRTATQIGLLVLATAVSACSKEEPSGPLLPEVSSIMFLQRVARNDQGNVFEYTSYTPGGRLVTLTPASADGKLSVLTSDPMFNDSDIMSYDLSFDAKSVVFSARLRDSSHYHVFTMNLDGTNINQLTAGENDYVYPIYLPAQRILYMTNLVTDELDPGAMQFQDEYERATTAQVGTMNLDGSDQVLGPRNVSHRVSPALLDDGRVLYTEWRHMGNVNDGHLRIMNADMTRMSEAFGGEEGGAGGTNSYLKARPVNVTTLANGTKDYRVVAIGTSRDRTLQAGKLLLVDLNGTEMKSELTDLTPLVPGGTSPSLQGVGRFYDAESVGNPNDRKFLVSWSDGPVESETLAMGMSTANFGIYVYQYDPATRKGTRYPIYDDKNYWDVLPRPIKARHEPAPTTSGITSTDLRATTVGALNVYDSSVATIPAGTAVKVRLIEGFSGEEGPRMFGTTEFDGQSLYGEIPVLADNSFAAKVPANVPFHMQVIDKFAMSIVNESIWISGRGGEERFCGGCHEDRAKTASLPAGIPEGTLRGAVDLNAPRAQRISTTAYALTAGSIANAAALRGMPWDKAIQPILDAKCVSCHEGTPGAANPSYMITDNMTGLSQTFVFDLRGDDQMISIGDVMTSDFSKSYISLMGLGELVSDENVTFVPEPKQYVVGGSARDSLLMRRLNPVQRFPTVASNVRAFAGQPVHPVDVGGQELTADEYYLLILSIDMGGQFFSRENKEGATY